MSDSASEEISDTGLSSEPPTAFRPFAFVDVTMDLPSPNPVVILQELDAPHRTITIPVGLAEGIAISFGSKQILTPRPLTHELMSNLLEAFGLEVVTLRITEFTDGIFHGELVVSGPERQRSLSCRVSDGIALCIRQRPFVPITVAPEVIELVGVES
jgi:bifunctional DNase/RNase